MNLIKVVGRLILVSLVMLMAVISPGYVYSATAMGGDKLDVFKNPTSPGEISLGGVDGKTIRLSDYAGKVVILNFWRKDCPYCVVEKDYLKSLTESLPVSDLAVLSVNLWDDPSWVRDQGPSLGRNIRVATKLSGKKSFVENIVKGRLMGYFVINEANEAVFEIKGFPSTYVLGKDGKIVAAHTGLVNWGSPSVNDTLRLFLRAEVQGRAAIPDAEIEWLNHLMKPPGEVTVSLLK